MYNHAPLGYQCPMCKLVSGSRECETKQEDIIFKDNDITAFIAAKWWPNNPGHVMIVPNKHFENLYDIPDDLLSKIYIFAKRVARAFKEIYKCNGTSTRQHNEHAGDQEMWHFHVHVFPRYNYDELYVKHMQVYLTKPEGRISYAKKLREYFNNKSNI